MQVPFSTRRAQKRTLRHLSTRGALEHLGLSGTWALRALRDLGPQALGHFVHLGTRTLKTLGHLRYFI